MSGLNFPSGSKRERPPRTAATSVVVSVLAVLILLSVVRSHNPRHNAAQPPVVPIVVAAAASMSDVLAVARTEFAQLHPNVKVEFNFGSTGALQRQIEAGAAVDLFISAAPMPIERLVEKGFVDRDAVTTLTSNRIVLIKPNSFDTDIESWEDLVTNKVKRIAIGNPDHVPAGQYAREALLSLGLWETLQPHLVLAENVRQVLDYVARGEVDAGVVYASDAAANDRVTIIAVAPVRSHPPVVYAMAVLDGARHPEAANLFAEYMLSPRGQELLAQFGFAPTASPAEAVRDGAGKT